MPAAGSFLSISNHPVKINDADGRESNPHERLGAGKPTRVMLGGQERRCVCQFHHVRENQLTAPLGGGVGIMYLPLRRAKAPALCNT
jgi:hypothetical protein